MVHDGKQRMLKTLEDYLWGAVCNIHTFVDRSTFVERKYFCDTEVRLSRQKNFCRDKSTFVETEVLLSRQKQFCRDNYFCRDRSTFVRTKILMCYTWSATRQMSHLRLLSRQNCLSTKVWMLQTAPHNYLTFRLDKTK